MKDFSLFLRRWLPVALWAGFVLYASTGIGSGNNTARFLKPILAWIHPDLGTASLTEINFFTRKTAHVVQFVFYTLLLWRGLSLPPPLAVRKRVLIAWALGSSALLALLSETIQIFSPLRTALFTDVLLDVGGAVIGTALVLGYRAISPRQRKKNGPRTPGSKARPSGKILITSDLHLDTLPDGGREILEVIRSKFSCSGADVLLVAGDFGVADRAGEWMEGLRRAAGPEACVVICLGNHDHWLQSETVECTTPSHVREKFWRPACNAHGIHCLDFENVRLPGITLCGGYAHYDYGFRDPDIRHEGTAATLSDYRKCRFAGLVYPDTDRIPGLETMDEAASQTKAISTRLSLAAGSGNPILFATHTLPFAKLIAQPHPRGSLSRFFDAYAGNSAIGNLLSGFLSPIALAVCGHTHRPTALLKISGIPCINTGSGPGHLRFLLFDSQTMSVAPFVQETESNATVA